MSNNSYKEDFLEKVRCRDYEYIFKGDIDPSWLNDIDRDSLEYLLRKSLLEISMVNKDYFEVEHYHSKYELILAITLADNCPDDLLELALDSDVRQDIFTKFKRPNLLKSYINGVNSKDLCSIITNKHADIDTFIIFDEFRSKSGISSILSYSLSNNEDLVLRLKMAKVPLEKICGNYFSPYFIPTFSLHCDLLSADDVLFIMSDATIEPVVRNLLSDNIKKNFQKIIENSDLLSVRELIKNIDIFR